MSRVIHFDLSVDDPERAVHFYKDVFGWQVNRWEGPEDYWLIQTGTESEPGITGGIANRVRSDDSTAVIFDVESVEEMAEKIVESGGEIREAKKVIPGVGCLVMCRDTEGNTFGIMEIDETVK